jgi:phosphoglycerate dehydrogenase-like enzyme
MYSVPMAEYATAAVLSLAHRMPTSTQLTHTRRWPDRDAQTATIIYGQTAGILGYGGVGRECARQLQALGMRIVCVSHGGRKSHVERFLAFPGTGDPGGEIPERWYTPDQLDEMLPLCDYLVVTAPRTPESLGLIGAKRLAMLPRNAHIIVVSRGGIVDETALAQALHSGHLGGAWIDTFTEEPPKPTNPLFDAPNIVLTPHVSGVYDSYWELFPRLLTENVRRLCGGEPLLNLAHGELGY